jgi:Zn-dependent peptidase ImmA (M78 family)
MPISRTMARIDRAAQRLLDAHGFTRPSVPVDELARSSGFSLVFDDLGGDDISGMLYRRGDTKLIVINQHHSHHRRRFTIAHELGHAELHDAETYLDGLATLRFRDGRSATGTDTEEREANGFAAAILMPADWVRTRFMRLVTGTNPTSESAAITRLAEQFDVSELAMRFRLVNLNLVDPA